MNEPSEIVTDNLHQVPHSVAAERAVLGAALIDPVIICELDLPADDFYLDRHRWIWQALRKLDDEKSSVDIITLQDELTARGLLAEIGGLAYLTRLTIETPTSLHASDYARIVREKAKRRRILAACTELARAAFSEAENLEGAISQATAQLVCQARPTGGAVQIRQFVDQLYDQVDERSRAPKDIYGIPTGFHDFDQITAGLQLGEELVLSGDPGLGKSLLAFQMGCNMASCAPGAVYELEMGGIAVVRRQVAGKSGVSTQKMRSGKLDDSDWPAFTAAVEKLSTLPIYMSDESNWTTLGMKADLARLKDAYGIQWFIVDYLDLLADSYGRDDIERSAYISRQVHNICKDLDLAGLIVQSMNKAGIASTNKGKHYLSGSAKVIFDADQIVFITKHQPAFGEKEEPNVITLTWDKVREGDSNRFMHLVRVEGFPAFKNYLAESKGREKAPQHDHWSDR